MGDWGGGGSYWGRFHGVGGLTQRIGYVAIRAGVMMPPETERPYLVEQLPATGTIHQLRSNPGHAMFGDHLVNSWYSENWSEHRARKNFLTNVNFW
jgi:hypothetical protein